MNNPISLFILALLTLALAGCSKHSSATTANQNVWDLGVVEVSDGVQIQRDLGGGRECTIIPAIQNDGSVLMVLEIVQDGKLLASPRMRTGSDHPVVMTIGDISIAVTPHIKLSVDAKDTVLSGRNMSEHQVADIVVRELPQCSSFRCEFKDGMWDVLEVQKDVWVSSAVTNADGHIFIHSTNATRVVLRVRDTDGKVEQITRS